MTCFLSACHKQVYTVKDLPPKQLVLGSYGGISGLDSKLVYLKSGEVYSVKTMPGGEPKLVFYERNKKKCRKMFKLAKKIEFSSLKPNDPCNMNYYIEMKKRFGKERSYQWCTLEGNSEKNKELINQLLNLQSK